MSRARGLTRALAVVTILLSATGLERQAEWRCWQPANPPSRTLESARRALRGDLASPLGWCDLGDALLAAGQPERAAYCFNRAAALGPNLPGVLMRAGRFQARAGAAAALPLYRHVLELVPDYDRLIFDHCSTLGLSTKEVLDNGIAENKRAVQSYFRYAMANAAVEQAKTIWDRLQEFSLAGDALADEYVNFLLHHDRYQEA
ncbi:MAG: hypothetical protein M1436_02225, partial [Acidobacteria bacterium]|nr:hypothetical protein [Acidobacteriota bacterium]